MKVIIMRGVPGAGKSTFVERYFPGATVCSVNAFFMQNGTYQLNPEDLPKAHQACWLAFISALQRKDELVVVDNTNIRVHEIAAYVLPAETMGYEVQIITIDIGGATAAKRNQHGVSEDTVYRLGRELEAHTELFPPHWQQDFVGFKQ